MVFKKLTNAQKLKEKRKERKKKKPVSTNDILEDTYSKIPVITLTKIN